MLKNGVNDKNNYFSKNMIVKSINIQVISVYESIFCVLYYSYYVLLKKIPPKINKEKEVIHNKIQKQLLTIL